MSANEKNVANELSAALGNVPDDAQDYVRGYLAGRLDAAKREIPTQRASEEA